MSIGALWLSRVFFTLASLWAAVFIGLGLTGTVIDGLDGYGLIAWLMTAALIVFALIYAFAGDYIQQTFFWSERGLDDLQRAKKLRALSITYRLALFVIGMILGMLLARAEDAAGSMMMAGTATFSVSFAQIAATLLGAAAFLGFFPQCLMAWSVGPLDTDE